MIFDCRLCDLLLFCFDLGSASVILPTKCFCRHGPFAAVSSISRVRILAFVVLFVGI